MYNLQRIVLKQVITCLIRNGGGENGKGQPLCSRQSYSLEIRGDFTWGLKCLLTIFILVPVFRTGSVESTYFWG